MGRISIIADLDEGHLRLWNLNDKPKVTQPSKSQSLVLNPQGPVGPILLFIIMLNSRPFVYTTRIRSHYS